MDQFMKIRHSGAIGDLIYSLPYVQSLGQEVDFYVGEHSYVTGKANKDTSEGLCKMIKNMYPLSNTIYNDNHSNFNALKQLLEYQDYIKSVHQDNTDQTYDLDLNTFRQSWDSSVSILEIVNKHFKWNFYQKDIPFLKSPKISGYEKTCVCFRSPRYVDESGKDRYRNVIKSLKDQTDIKSFIFVGIEKEYEYFNENIYELDYYKTQDMLDVATIINSTPIGIYNCSAPLAIAVGLSKPRFIEDPTNYIIHSVKQNSINERFF